MKIFRSLIIFLTALFSFHAYAMEILIDSEIERGVRKLIDPILKASGSDPKDVNVYILLDNNVNAFVAGGRNIFINTGTITLFNDPDVLKGIVAHELGHIAGGHLARNSEKIREITTQSMLTTLVGAAAMVGGAGDVGSAIVMGSAHTANRSFMSHSRTQESSADQAAMKFLHASHNSVRGLVILQEYFNNEQSSFADQINPYSITHPLSKERLGIAQTYLRQEKSGYGSTDEEKKIYSRLVAKLRGFIEPIKLLTARNEKNLDPFSRKYELAIAMYRQPNLRGSLEKLDELIKEEPKNAYLYQLKGQFLFEHGKIRESVLSYKKAIEYLPNDNILKAEYALALVNSADIEKDQAQKSKILKESIDILNAVAGENLKSPYIYRSLATAYGKLGDLSNSNLMLAEEAILYNNYSEAQKFASLAKKYAKNDTKMQLKIDDVIKTLRNKQ